MSLVTVLQCDGCHRECETAVFGYTTAWTGNVGHVIGVRRDLKLPNDWIVVGERDYCSECVARGKAKP